MALKEFSLSICSTYASVKSGKEPNHPMHASSRCGPDETLEIHAQKMLGDLEDIPVSQMFDHYPARPMPPALVTGSAKFTTLSCF